MKDIQKKNSLNERSKSKKRITFHAMGMLAMSCCMVAPVMAEGTMSETQTFLLAEQSHKITGIVLDETGEPFLRVQLLISMANLFWMFNRLLRLLSHMLVIRLRK